MTKDYGCKRGGKKGKKKRKKKKGMWQVVNEMCERVDVRQIRKINVSYTCQYVVLNWCVFCPLLLRVIVKQIWKHYWSVWIGNIFSHLTLK